MDEKKENTNVVLEFLYESEYINEDQYREILDYARENRLSGLDAITQSGVIDHQNAVEYIAREHGLEFMHLEDLDIDKDALLYLEQKDALKFQVIPYRFQEGSLYVVAPIDRARSMQLKSDLRRITKIGSIFIAVAHRSEILKAIETNYRQNMVIESDVQEMQIQSPVDEIPDELTEESQVVKFVDLVLTQAVKDKASDIHFDPQEYRVDIRYRIDGILKNITYAPIDMVSEIVSRVKIMSNLDIAEKRIPQDGRLEYEVAGRPIDFRVATLPSIFGEKIVMRILDNSSAQLALTDLGFTDYNLERFRKAAHKPYGMLLVTGPTGSGKSTTLYAALNEINSPEINIITAEDPVEYQLAGITQVPVKAPMTFEKVLRTVLRADPDVVLIGEIRDRETAEIAMKAGMTGHMVFSTLHTNDAASTLSRLGDMAVEPFIIASTVEGIVSQRLVRRLCAKCKAPGDSPTDVELEAVGFDWDIWKKLGYAETGWHKPVGCKVCGGSGYKGRAAIHEVLLVNDDIQAAVIRGEKALAVEAIAKEEGMVNLRMDGLIKAAQGLTTIQEVVRVVG